MEKEKEKEKEKKEVLEDLEEASLMKRKRKQNIPEDLGVELHDPKNNDSIFSFFSFCHKEDVYVNSKLSKINNS